MKIFRQVLVVLMVGSFLPACTTVGISEAEAVEIAQRFASQKGVPISDYRQYSVCYFPEHISVLFEAKIPAAGDHFSVQIGRRDRKLELDWGR